MTDIEICKMVVSATFNFYKIFLSSFLLWVLFLQLHFKRWVHSWWKNGWKMTEKQHTYHGLKNVQKIRGTTVPTVTNLHFDWYIVHCTNTAHALIGNYNFTKVTNERRICIPIKICNYGTVVPQMFQTCVQSGAVCYFSVTFQPFFTNCVLI